jgi:quinol monooxygenase YgiN
MAAGVVHIPWYVTLFRADAFEAALTEFAPTALRYGATDYRVYRSRDDGYKFLHMATFEEKSAFEAYWYGPEFNHFRAAYSSYYQVPILYVWHDLVLHGAVDEAPATAGAPNGT